MEKPKVLIVEDEELFVKAWMGLLKNEVEIVSSSTIEDAERIVGGSLDFALMVVDCCVPGNKPNTQALVRLIREKGFKEPIIAKSTDSSFTTALLNDGASHRAAPWEVPPLIRNLLFGTAPR